MVSHNLIFQVRSWAMSQPAAQRVEGSMCLCDTLYSQPCPGQLPRASSRSPVWRCHHALLRTDLFLANFPFGYGSDDTPENWRWNFDNMMVGLLIPHFWLIPIIPTDASTLLWVFFRLRGRQPYPVPGIFLPLGQWSPVVSRFWRPAS